jgi:MFS family permease
MAVDDIAAGAHDNSNDGSTPGGGGEADRLGPGIWKITAVAVAGAFMPLLSTTMVNVSLLSLAGELHASLSAIQWVTSGYLLALAVMLPLTGWLVDRIGAKALYLWSFAAFTLSSTLCGLAWSADALIAIGATTAPSPSCSPSRIRAFHEGSGGR